MQKYSNRLIYTLLLLIFCTAAAGAQKRVAGAVKTAEGHNTTQYCAYSERRDPATHKVVRSSKVLVVSAKDAAAIRKAMDADRNNAISCEMVNGGNVYSLTFYKDKMRTVYTLLMQRNNTWLLTVEEYAERRSGTRVEADSILPLDFYEDMEELMSLISDLNPLIID